MIKRIPLIFVTLILTYAIADFSLPQFIGYTDKAYNAIHTDILSHVYHTYLNHISYICKHNSIDEITLKKDNKAINEWGKKLEGISFEYDFKITDQSLSYKEAGLSFWQETYKTLAQDKSIDFEIIDLNLQLIKAYAIDNKDNTTFLMVFETYVDFTSYFLDQESSIENKMISRCFEIIDYVLEKDSSILVIQSIPHIESLYRNLLESNESESVKKIEDKYSSILAYAEKIGDKKLMKITNQSLIKVKKEFSILN